MFDSLSEEFQINRVTHLSRNEPSCKEVQVLDKMKVMVDQTIESKEQIQVQVYTSHQCPLTILKLICAFSK